MRAAYATSEKVMWCHSMEVFRKFTSNLSDSNVAPSFYDLLAVASTASSTSTRILPTQRRRLRLLVLLLLLLRARRAEAVCTPPRGLSSPLYYGSTMVEAESEAFEAKAFLI